MSLLGLTAEQSEIASADPSTRMLVAAGPGTGKTHTLVARIGHLVDFHDVNPGGILALSFSRSAVGELHRRLRATGEDAGRVAPVTFDSFATRMLSHVDPEGAWTEQSFDGRIQAAIEVMAEIGEFLARVEHVCVDEVQDLVSVRMRFVRALLGQLDVGFTLLGDQAQGIYDFALADDETSEEDGAPALVEWVRCRYGEELVERSLTVNHRAKSDLAKRAAAVGPRVIGDSEGAMQELLDLVGDAPRLPSLATLRFCGTPQRTAVLCHNNGDVLWISRFLSEQNIDHIVQRHATNRSVAPWLGRLIMATGGGILSRGRFERQLAELGGAIPEPADVWPALRRVAGDDLGIDLGRLTQRLRTGVVPDELHVVNEASIVVSTVHRAKGLEFDRVVVIDSGWTPPYDEEDARTMFVAVSRTIETLTTANPPDVNGRLMKDDRTDRWVHAGWQRWMRLGMEVRPDDVDTRNPPGSFLLNADAAEIQACLAERVHPGDPVSIELIRPKIGEPGAIYGVVWQGRAIALASDQFGLDVMRVVKALAKWKFPRRIDNVTVDAVRTVGGDPLLTNQEGLGPGGAWLVPSLVGLGRFYWKE